MLLAAAKEVYPNKKILYLNFSLCAWICRCVQEPNKFVWTTYIEDKVTWWLRTGNIWNYWQQLHSWEDDIFFRCFCSVSLVLRKSLLWTLSSCRSRQYVSSRSRARITQWRSVTYQQKSYFGIH